MRANVRLMTLLLAVLAASVIAGCSRSEPPASPVAAIDPAKAQLFAPLPDVMDAKAEPITEEKVALGRMLYYEPRLSKSHQISCNSCHKLDEYGVDGEPTSDGHKGRKGDRNSPTVYNAAGHVAQFWDGRAEDVEAQAKGPVLNPAEMAMATEKEVVAVLKSMPGYVEAFQKAFPQDEDPVTYHNMARAIGAFERKLVTQSRWDAFLRGESTALTAEEKVGFNTFVAAGCQTCHAGTYVGGNRYQKLGSARPWPDESDPGREKVTKSADDRLVFKVPSLRNVDKTGPYYHNGKIETLEGAVSKMAEYQLDKKLTDDEVRSIVTWLKALTGEIPGAYIKEPQLPKSTSKTPKPNTTD